MLARRIRPLVLCVSLLGSAAFAPTAHPRRARLRTARRAADDDAADDDAAALLEQASRLRAEISAAEAESPRAAAPAETPRAADVPAPPPVAAAAAKRDEERAGGRRTLDTRGELEQLVDVGMRFEGLWALVDGLRRSGLREAITPGCAVIARRSCEQHGIAKSQSYECQAIYFQGVNASTGRVERVDVARLDAAAPAGCDGWTRYVRLFSPEYHAAPVVVTPEEAGLVSLRAEVLDSLGVALPVLAFWVSVSLSFVAYGSLAGSSPG